MAITTNRSPLKGKMDIPEGEYRRNPADPRLDDQADIERENSNDPLISAVGLGGRREYDVGMKKSPDKKDKERR